MNTAQKGLYYNKTPVPGFVSACSSCGSPNVTLRYSAGSYYTVAAHTDEILFREVLFFDCRDCGNHTLLVDKERT